jgi:Tfp pilus assembly protein PilO
VSGIDAGRVTREKRALVLPLAIGLALNLAVYAIVIYPRTSSAGAMERRAQVAAQARARAAAELKEVEAVGASQSRAVEQLATFYDRILPQGPDGARRITYLRLAELADETGLDYERRTIAIEPERESSLRRMNVTMQLAGEYRDVRRFINRLETAPEFIVIDDIALSQGQRDAPLALAVRLSTYYKAAP